MIEGFVLPECLPALAENFMRLECRITLQSLCDFLKRRGWVDKEVHMIGHDDVREKPIETTSLFPMMERFHNEFGYPRIPQPARPEASGVQRTVEFDKSFAMRGLFA